MRVLLVEDEPALADILARNLTARGHQVTIEETAESAIVSMAHEWPEALIIDINLPGEHSGWEILRHLTPGERDGLKVIVMSAAPISEKRIGEFKPLQALHKPFPIDALVRALDGSGQGNSMSDEALS